MTSLLKRVAEWKCLTSSVMQLSRFVAVYHTVSSFRLDGSDPIQRDTLNQWFSWLPFLGDHSTELLEDQMAHLGRWCVRFLQRTPDNCGPVPEPIVIQNCQRYCRFSCTKKALYKSPTTFRNLVVFVMDRGRSDEQFLTLSPLCKQRPLLNSAAILHGYLKLCYIQWRGHRCSFRHHHQQKLPYYQTR